MLSRVLLAESTWEPWVWPPTPHKAEAWWADLDPRPQEVRMLGVQGHPGLHCKFEVSLRCIRPYLKCIYLVLVTAREQPGCLTVVQASHCPLAWALRPSAALFCGKLVGICRQRRFWGLGHWPGILSSSCKLAGVCLFWSALEQASKYNISVIPWEHLSDLGVPHLYMKLWSQQMVSCRDNGLLQFSLI